MVRALASHQCGPGSIPGLGVICGLSLLLGLVLAPRGFSPDTPVIRSPQKPTFPDSSSILESKDYRFVSRNRLLSVILVKPSRSRSLMLVKSCIGIHFFGDKAELTAQLEKHSHLSQKLPRQMIVSHWKTTTRSGVAIFLLRKLQLVLSILSPNSGFGTCRLHLRFTVYRPFSFFWERIHI